MCSLLSEKYVMPAGTAELNLVIMAILYPPRGFPGRLMGKDVVEHPPTPVYFDGPTPYPTAAARL